MSLTPDTLPARLSAALTRTRAEVPTSYPHVYPAGDAIRFRVPAPDSVQLPPLLDPVGLMYLADTGQYTGILDALPAALALGMDAETAISLLEASDRPLARLDDAGRRWREALLDVVNHTLKGR